MAGPTLGRVVTSSTQGWELAVAGARHRVEVAGSFIRVLRWYVDGELVASAQASGDRIRLRPGDRLRGGRKDCERSGLGVIDVRFTVTGRPRRVTWHATESGTSAQVKVELGLGGLDLDPDPGSSAARREERIRRQPGRHAAVATAVGLGRVLVAVLAGLLVVRLLPDLPWPDVDLPAVPWPDLPAVPWPDVDLPDVQLPTWARRVAGVLHYAWPVLLAAVLAWAELRRRRRQDELKARLRAQSEQQPQL